VFLRRVLVKKELKGSRNKQAGYIRFFLFFLRVEIIKKLIMNIINEIRVASGVLLECSIREVSVDIRLDISFVCSVRSVSTG